MKDILGYLKRVIWIFSILFLTFFTFPKQADAQVSLATSSVFSHNIKESDNIETTITFTVSSPSRTVLTYYTITIPQTDIDPEIYSITKNKELESTVYNRSNSTDILIDLENTVIPANGSIKISISYLHEYDDSKTISLVSKIIDTPTSEVSVTYPKEWGETNWVSDQIDNIKTSDTSYIIRIPEPDSTSIKLIFSPDIIYSFEISKAFYNNSDFSNQYEVILPHDNEFQKIIIEDMNIQPTQTFLDNNNNYILIFTLEPNSQVDVKIFGYIVMEKHQYYNDDMGTQYDNNDIYWSLENRQIERIDRYLIENGITEETNHKTVVDYIYKYVIENLTPSSSSTTLSGGVRRGAAEILTTTEKSTPEDYADVLKTLLSYYEIPCIYTLGYVSEISNYQDNGMFHYWIQAFDGEEWVVLDPYLEDFSNISLLGRQQLDHISILSRTYDSISPVLTYYSDNDIRFEYQGDSDVEYTPDSNISISLEPYSILNKYLYGNITVENTGNTIFTTIELGKSEPELNKYIDSVTNSAHTILLPHMQSNINFHIPFNAIEEDLIFTTIELKSGLHRIDSEIISTEYSLSDHTGYEVVIKLVSILLFLITFSLIYLFIDKIIYRK